MTTNPFPPTHSFITHFSSHSLLIYLLWFCGLPLCSFCGSNSKLPDLRGFFHQASSCNSLSHSPSSSSCLGSAHGCVDQVS